MRRRSSSICRLVRDAVPVRTTVAVMSARPGCVCATTALPLRKKSCAEIFGNVSAFGQHHLQAVRKRANGALRPGDRAFRAERRSARRALNR